LKLVAIPYTRSGFSLRYLGETNICFRASTAVIKSYLSATPNIHETSSKEVIFGRGTGYIYLNNFVNTSLVSGTGIRGMWVSLVEGEYDRSEGGWGSENISQKNGEAAVSTHQCARISAGYPPPVTKMTSESGALKSYESLRDKPLCISIDV